MIAPNPRFKFADLFCGLGGFTKGAEESGHARGALAINHWRPAISSHETNHPHVRHICASIDHVDPREFRNEGLNMLLASPECVGHCHARGGRPIHDQRRATAWCVPRWIEAHRYDYAIIENVREFEQWGPVDDNGKRIKSHAGQIFEAWIQTIRACGYHVEWKVLNGADYGLPQTRSRLFVVARRGQSDRPFPWPEPTHARENWTPAYTIIDWSLPIGSIFDRPKALAPNTIARIEHGLHKFVGPFIAQYHNGSDAKARVYDVGQPLPTVDTQNRYALTIPYIVKNRGTGKSVSMDDPAPTVTAGGNHLGVAIPFLAAHFGERDGQAPRVHDLLGPLPTVTHRGAGDLVVPFVVPNEGYYRGNQPRSVDEPLPTVTANRGAGHLCIPFITKYYGTAKSQSVYEPLGTVTTKDRYGLVLAKTMADLGVVDIFYRMFVTHELAAAQGFERDYYLHGTDTEQKMQIGNAVPPIFAKVLLEACARDSELEAAR
jgi:DNA (cytosine-5)-methyltransferase 1